MGGRGKPGPLLRSRLRSSSSSSSEGSSEGSSPSSSFSAAATAAATPSGGELVGGLGGDGPTRLVRPRVSSFSPPPASSSSSFLSSLQPPLAPYDPLSREVQPLQASTRYSLSTALTDKRTHNSLVPVYEAHSRFSRIRNDLSATSSLHQIRAQALLDKLRRAGEDTKALAAASIDALVDQFTAEVVFRALYPAKRRTREKKTEATS
jgi:hypothetical protein